MPSSGSVALDYFHTKSELNIRVEIRTVTMGAAGEMKPLRQSFSQPVEKYVGHSLKLFYS